jgi:hypothetical protein
VNEDTARDARNLVKLLITDTFPWVGKVLAVLEATVLSAHRADAPLCVRLLGLGEQHVENLVCCVLFLEVVEMVGPRHAIGQNQDATLGIVLQTLGEGLCDSIAGWEPCIGTVSKFDEKLLANESGCFLEARVFLGLPFLLGLVGARGRCLTVVVAIDDAGNAEPTIFELLGDVGGGKILWGNDIDTVVVCIEGFDEVGVDLLEQDVEIWSSRKPRHGGDDVFAKVHVDKASRGQLGVVSRKDGGELALVMVVPLAGIVVLGADIDDRVAGGQDIGIAGAHERRGGVGRQETEHGDGEGLVCVEVAAVGANERSFHLGPLSGVLGGHGSSVVRCAGRTREEERAERWGVREQACWWR